MISHQRQIHPIGIFALGVLSVTLLGGSALIREDEKARQEAEEIAKAVGKKMNFVETKNFTWASSIPVSRTKYVASAAESAYKIFASRVGVKRWQQVWGEQKCMGVILPGKRDGRKYNRWYAKKYPVWDEEQFLRLHDQSTYWYESASRRVMVLPLKPNTDEFIASQAAHLTGHLLTNRYAFHNNFVPPWLEESVAAYLESRVMKKLVCRCFSEAYGVAADDDPSEIGYKLTRWKARLKRAYGKKQVKSLKGIFRPRMHELGIRDIVTGYATVAWMLSQDGKLGEFLRVLKREWPKDIVWEYDDGHGEAQRKAFKEVFGMSLADVETAVGKFVASEF